MTGTPTSSSRSRTLSPKPSSSTRATSAAGTSRLAFPVAYFSGPHLLSRRLFLSAPTYPACPAAAARAAEEALHAVAADRSAAAAAAASAVGATIAAATTGATHPAAAGIGADIAVGDAGMRRTEGPMLRAWHSLERREETRGLHGHLGKGLLRIGIDLSAFGGKALGLFGMHLLHVDLCRSFKTTQAVHQTMATA